MATDSPPTNPGSAYAGTCNNCGRVIRAVVFFDWRGVVPHASIKVGCGCSGSGWPVTLGWVPGTVTTAAVRGAES